jgi:choline dehydrogenase-like flavoprotein
MTSPVDVLTSGAGASGAAVAWSLAETKMSILCLEQGDWMKPSEYPSTARDWAARQFDDFSISRNCRARATDYPINYANSPIKIANFNGIGAARCFTPVTSRASIHRISACGRWMASPTTGRSTTRHSRRSTPRTTGSWASPAWPAIPLIRRTNR